MAVPPSILSAFIFLQILRIPMENEHGFRFKASGDSDANRALIPVLIEQAVMG
jgi:hypothetical protein